MARQLRRRRASIERLIEANPPNANHLFTAVSEAVGLAALLSLEDPTDLELIESLRAAGRAGAAGFAALGAASAVDIEVVPGEVRTIEPIVRDSRATPNTWRAAFFAASCVGDREALDRLTKVNLDVMRDSPTSAIECLYLEVHALCGFHERSADAPERLAKALRSADPTAVSPDERDFVLDVVNRELELYFRLMSGNASELNESLREAVADHKRYFSRGESARIPAGQLALGALAVACVANDRGLAITVDSDYLPNAVIEYPRN